MRSDFFKTHLNVIVFIAILLAGLFILLYKSDSFPPAIHYDQITSPITSELSKRREVELDERTKINNALTLSNLAASIIPRFRTTESLHTLEFIIKLPSMLFFLLSIPIWWGILDQLKFKLFSRIIFFSIYIFSPMYILYSHFIPINAAFLCYTSLFLFFLLKAILRENLDALFFVHFAVSILFGIAAFYTHIVAIVIIAVIYFTIFILVTPSKLVSKFRKIRPAALGFAAFSGLLITALFIILFFGYYSYASGGEAIKERESYTRIADIQKGGAGEILLSGVQRIAVYLDPRYLALGINQFSSGNSKEFSEFLNPEQSVWLIQNVGPVGLAGIVLFITPLFLTFNRKKETSLASTLILALFLGYLSVAAISKYDNPGTARVLPLLLVVPLGISHIINSINYSSFKTSLKTIFFAGIGIGLTINTIYTFAVMYSPNYYESEAGKFETGVREASEKILSVNDLSHVRLYLNSPTWSATRYFQMYLGTDIINKTTTYQDPLFLSSLDQSGSDIPVFVTTTIGDLTYVESSLNLEVESFGKYHVGIPRSAATEETTLAWVTPSTTYLAQALPYKRHLEYDEIYPTLSLYEASSDKKVFTNNISNASEYTQNILTDASGEITNGTLFLQTPVLSDLHSRRFDLSEDLSDSIVIDNNTSISGSDGTYSFDDTDTSSMLFLHIPKAPQYTSYVLSLSTQTQEGSPLGVVFFDETHKKYIEAQQVTDTDYAFNFSDSNQIIVTLINNPRGEPGRTVNQIQDITLYGIKSANLENEYITETRRSANADIWFLSPRKGAGQLKYSLSNTCDTSTIVLEKPFDPGWHLSLDGERYAGTPELINGYVVGWTVDGNTLCGARTISFSWSYL